MSANGQVATVTPADDLRARFDDPAVAAALNNVLDHAELLAFLLGGLDGMLRRGDEITESLAGAIHEIRDSAAVDTVPGIESLKNVDLQALADSLTTLSGALVKATPAINTLLSSRLTDPQAVDVLANLGEALVDSRAAARSDPAPTTLRGLWRMRKDKDVLRGLGFMMQVAREFGRRIGSG